MMLLIWKICLGEKTEKTLRNFIKIQISINETILILVLFPILSFCQKIPHESDPKENQWGLNTARVDSLNGKPISFYLKHPKIDKLSKAYYNSKFAIFDNEETFGIMDSVLTDNNEIRPFYFYILNRIMEHSDGAISEVVSGVCAGYFKKYPCEYFYFSSVKKYKVKNQEWAGYIGFDLYDPARYRLFTSSIEKKLKANCPEIQLKKWPMFKVKIKEALPEP